MNEAIFLENLQNSQGIIYKLVSLYANDDDEKKDLYQEVVLQAWKGWPSFRSEAKFSTWLYRVCLNTIFDRAIISMHLDGFENAEIAAIIGINARHVSVKLYRIKLQLANRIKSNV